VSEAVTVAR
jgi:hypothetical protein